MYSLTSEANTVLHRFLLKDVYFNQYANSQRGIRFGVKLPTTGPAYESESKTLLFMAGAAEANPERLEYVLDARGLRLLLQAGGELARSGYKLVLAIPFLRDAQMLARLKQHPDNQWDTGSIEYRDEVRVPDIFQGIGAFVFPYGQEEQQFVPTSIVEAMHFGIPVVLPRLDFLAQFHRGAEKGLIYAPDSVDSLVNQIRRLEHDPKQVQAIRTEARRFVETEYNIANTVVDLERIYLNLK